MDLALCTGAQSCWKRKEPFSNCSHKDGRMALSKISWYAEAFRFLFTGTNRPTPAPKKQPNSIPPFYKLYTIQSDKYRSPSSVYAVYHFVGVLLSFPIASTFL
ncbi:hypothetical protein GOODEAATRI_021617 [Goodea atripinnis]|uniref:Uncharacterized protein n=1 Tax=Goodea atripinnis TaxID=208336 RepID=A0ABV0P6R5_9TELE